MKLIELKAKLSEELLETIFHFAGENNFVLESIIFKAIDKTPSYLKVALNFIKQLNIINICDDKIEITSEYLDRKKEVPKNVLKTAISEFRPLQEFTSLIRQGKSDIKAAKFMKTSFNIVNEPICIIRILSDYRKYLESEFANLNRTEQEEAKDKSSEKSIFWIDQYGQLGYIETACTMQIIERIEKRRFKNPEFIDQNRISALRAILNPQFDLSKLIKICEEINDAFRAENYFSVGVLVRAIMDHIPPIFGMKSFSEVANNYGPKSFKDVMCNLESFNRKIADGILHTHIRRKEFLPNMTSVDCRSGIDLLLGEIINELN